MRKTKLLLVALLAMLGSSVFAQSWTAPTVTGEAPVDGTTYKLFNVGGAKYLTEGQAWFSWNTTAILADNGSDFTFTGDGTSFTLTTHRSGNSKVFTSGNEIPGDAMHLDGQNATNYRYAQLPNGHYRIHDAAATDDTKCWGYELIAKTGGQAQRDSWGVVAHSDASTIGAYGEWMFVGEASSTLYAAQFKLYNQLNQAQTEGVNTDEAAAVYNNSSATVEDLNAAYNALGQAIFNNRINNASETSPADITEFIIVNPSFENGLSSWTNSGMQTQGNNSFGKKVGASYCEAWQPNGTKGVSQALANLPQGLYRLTANALARGVTSAKLYAGKAETTIEIKDEAATYTVEFACKDGITIGFEGVGTGAGASWLCVDDFHLNFVKSLTDQELIDYELAAVKGIYDAALAAAKAFDQTSIPTAAKNALQGAIAENEGTYSTEEAYTAATTALNEAIANAEAFVSPYKRYLDKVNAIKNMKDADTYSGSNAKSTLESILSETDENVEAATTAEAIDAETAKLVPAAKAFVKGVTINPDACLDITCLIENPHFIYGKGGGNVATGWSLASGGSITEHRLSTHNFEAWHRQFDLSQTITDLPKGTFKVTLQGFARHDNASITDKTFLYCGVKTVAVKDIRAEWSTSSYYKSGDPQMGDGNYDSSYQKDGVTVYQPNGMTGAYYWFQHTNPETGLPFYTSEVETLLTEDGDLKIGFKCETGEDWVLWDNFHLYYYGSAIAVTLDEAEGSAYSEDIENANVTLKKTISEGWNTVILPIAATKSEIGATELYTYTGNEEGKLMFTSADEIEPNVPYLMKASAAITEPMTFNGVTVKAAAESLVAEGDNFNFVGTYTGTTALEGDYVLTENAFTKANGGNTIKAYRAYIKTVADAAEEASARELLISIDGVLTAIDAIDGKKISTGAIYNLAGQKVKKAQKGIFIQDGKKVIVK